MAAIMYLMGNLSAKLPQSSLASAAPMACVESTAAATGDDRPLSVRNANSWRTTPPTAVRPMVKPASNSQKVSVLTDSPGLHCTSAAWLGIRAGWPGSPGSSSVSPSGSSPRSSGWRRISDDTGMPMKRISSPRNHHPACQPYATTMKTSIGATTMPATGLPIVARPNALPLRLTNHLGITAVATRSPTPVKVSAPAMP